MSFLVIQGGMKGVMKMPVGTGKFSTAFVNTSSSVNDAAECSYGFSVSKKISGVFENITSQNTNCLTARLNLNILEEKIANIGIKISLEGNLEMEEKKESDINVYDFYLGDSLLNCGDLLQGKKTLDFNLNISHNEPWPSPFSSSIGKLKYVLVATIGIRDGWETFAKQELTDFIGYYNANWVSSGPSIDTKYITETSRCKFTSCSGSVLRGETLQAILELDGLIKHTKIKGTVTLQRKIGGVANEVSTIWTKTQKTEAQTQLPIVMDWSIEIPSNARTTYENAKVGIYSVAYFLKYEVKLSGKMQQSVEGQLELAVGTARDPLTDSSTIDPVMEDHHLEFPGGSAESSLLVLPSYSQLSSRASSMATLPPHYDDI